MARFSCIALFFIVPVMMTAQLKFDKHKISTPSGYDSWIYDLETADIDNDGDIDIVYAGQQNHLAWAKNDGNGNFTLHAVGSQPDFLRPIQSIYIVDLDRDGYLDVLSASDGDDRIQWYKNSGTPPSITWTTHPISTSADAATGVFAGDLNGDNLVDVVSASISDGKVAWYQNMGGDPPTWTEQALILSSSADKNIIVADLDNDGNMDIISNNTDMNIYLNDNASPGANLVPGFDQSSMVTSMSYGENMTAYLGDPRSWPAPNYTRQIIDFNNDNRVDIVSGFAGNAIGIWMNQGFPGTPFTHHDLFLPSEISDPHSVQVADLDSDGDLDLISTSNKNVVGIHLNTGVSFSSNLENSFKSIPVGREHPLYNQSNSGRAVAVALINNDSQLDIVVGKDAGTHSEPLVWFEGRVDNTAATVTHVTAVKLDGTYGIGEIIPVEVHFSEGPIDMDGNTPQLTLDLDGTPKTINYYSLKDTVMTFLYTVAAGDNSSGLAYSSASALDFNGGTIETFGNSVDLSLKAPGHAQSLSGSKALVIDTDPPGVTSVNSTKADGTYGLGEVIPITVTFSENVDVQRQNQLDANYTSEQGAGMPQNFWQSFTAERSGKLVQLDIILNSPLKNRSATGTLKIYSGEGNSAPNELHSQDVTFHNGGFSWRTFYLTTPISVILGQKYTYELTPTETADNNSGWVRLKYSDGYAGGKNNMNPNYEALFKTYVRDDGAPFAMLNLAVDPPLGNHVFYTSGTGTNTLTFDYTVETGHNSSRLDYKNTSSLSCSVPPYCESIKDAAGNDADLDLFSPGATNSLGANRNIVINTVPPTVTFDPLDAVVGVDPDKAVTITFSDNVVKHDPSNLNEPPLNDVIVSTMFELKQDDANGSPAATGINATWDGANNRITINHDDFSSEQVVYAALKANMVEDAYNNPVPAQNVTFTVKDAMAPTVDFNPDNLETGVSLASDIIITFNEAVRQADVTNSALDNTNVDGHITLKEDDANGADIPFDATIDAATYVITVDPTTDFEGEKSIYACIDDQIEDFSDNAISQKCVTFDTEDVAPPVVTLSPYNGEPNVPIASGLIIQFSEPVRNILGDLANPDGIPLDDNNVDNLITLKIDDVNGAPLGFDAEVKLSRQKITIAPDNNFTSEQVIYYCIDPVEDYSDNATSQKCATFTAADIEAPSITIDPADATIDVPVDKIITFTSSEALKRVDGQALNDANVDDFINLHETSSSGAAINFDATIEAGSSLSFDGVDDYVDINTLADDMAGQTDWAVSFWAKPTIASFPEGAADIFAVNCDNGSNNCNKISINIKRDNSAIQVFEDPGGTTIAGSATSDGDWNHVVYSRTGSTGTLYLNGTSQGTHTPAHPAFAASDKWSLAQEFDGTAVTNEFFGLMDEVAFWNSDLAANEVTALYNSGISLDASTNSGDYTSSADIAGYWKMNEGTGTTLTDLSSNSNNGTINNAIWEAASPSGNRIISVDPTDDLPSMQLVYVAIWAGVTDYDGNAITPANSTFTTVDAEPPTVAFDPADGITDVLVSKTITLTFSEAIRNTDDTALTDTNVDGHITLKEDDASGADIPFDATIDAAKKVITVDPTNDFDSEQKVYVAINDQVVEDDADNAVDLASAIFTVEDILGPSATFFPVPNATSVPINTVPTITFSEPVLNTDATDVIDANVEALITFKEGTDATGADIALGSVTINAAKTVITLNPAANFTSEIDVYMCVDPVEDEHGNESIQQCATFKTSDVIAPVVTWDPLNGSTDVPIAQIITLTFDDPVRKEDDTALTDTNVDALITLKLTDANGAAVPFDATISAAKDKIFVDPTAFLGSKTTYYAAIGATVEDDKDNAILASSSMFITVDSEAPAVAFSPIDGATNITLDTTIVLTFSEPVRLVANDDAMTNTNIEPLITLEKVLASGLEKVDIGAAVSTNNKEVTLTPQALLLSEQLYKISIGATVEDFSDNAIVAASAQFTTKDGKPPTVTFNPADGDTEVSVTTDITITFDEVVRLLDDSNLTNDNVDTLIVLKDTDLNGADIPFDATVNNSKTEITVSPNSDLSTRQTVYVGIKAKVEDDGDNAINAASVIFSTEETPEIIISQPSVAYTTEAGGKSLFSLKLGKEPTSKVIVDIKSKDESEGKASDSQITFSTTFWSEIDTIEVAGQNDDIDDGDVTYEIEVSGVVSDDSRYNGIDPDDVQLVNKDDGDTAGFTIIPVEPLVTTEAGEKDTFSLKLTSEPIAKLSIPLVMSKEKEGSLSADSLIFTSANWSTFQEVIVTGLNDSIIDGDRNYKILTQKPVSDDSLYASRNPKDIIVTNRAREPLMSVSVDTLDFGRVFRDSYSVKNFDVINAGTDTLRFTNGAIDTTVFITGATAFNIAPRDTFRVGIQFLPEEALVYEGEFTAEHNDFSKGDLKIKLKGEALKPTIATVDSIVDFGDVHVYFDELMKLLIYNKGNSDLRIDSLEVTGEQFSAPVFETTYIKPADTSNVIVRFSSPETGKAVGNVRIFSSDQDNPKLDIPIQATIFPPDTLGPSFEEISMTPEEPKLRQGITIDATLNDATRVGEVIFHILEGGQKTFKGYIMLTEDENNYEFVSKPEDITLNGIAFYMTASDIRGNVATSDTLSPPVKFIEGSLQTTQPTSVYGDGLPKKQWRLVSIPANLDDPNVENTLSDDFGGHSKQNTWRIFEPVKSSGSGSSKWKKPKQFDAGKGYWLIQDVKKNVAFSTGQGETITLKGFNMTLDPGWNMISSPYTFPMIPSLDPTSFYGPLTYGKESEGWSEEMTMLPFGGYLIYNRLNSTETVSLEPLDFSSMTKTRTLAREISDGEWKLQLNAEGENYSDIGNIIGRLSDAEEGIDHFDNPEPPYLDKYVSMTFEIDNPSTKLPSMNSDIRSVFVRDGVWDAAVQIKGEKGPIILSYVLEGKFPIEDAMVMLDMSTREHYNLLDEETIEITEYSEDFPYRFKIFAGSPEFVASAMADALSLLPDEFTLRQNYPNPFNPSTTIEFTLPQPTEISLVIYNLMGQEVRTLKRGMTDTGHHSILWHGKDNRGQLVSSGVYLVRFYSPEFTASHKMVLMK